MLRGQSSSLEKLEGYFRKRVKHLQRASRQKWEETDNESGENEARYRRVIKQEPERSGG